METECHSSTQILQVHSIKMKTLAILLAVHVTISLASLQVATEHGILTLEGRQKRGAEAHIKGFFRSVDGDGIRFHTTANSLKVSTMDGQTLVKYTKVPVRLQTYGENDENMVFQLLDNAYVESNKKTYRVVDTDIDTVTTQDHLTSSQLLASLQARALEDPQAAIKASVERLVAHPASRLLEPAARALGEDLGVTGKDEPAAMPFYMTAMKLAEARSRSERRRISRNSFSSYFYRPAVIQAYPNCDLTTCPPCQEDDCMGMCGRNCDCWDWLCGDCCLHNGCAMHDDCCRKNGHNSPKCFFPIGLTCDKYIC